MALAARLPQDQLKCEKPSPRQIVGAGKFERGEPHQKSSWQPHTFACRRPLCSAAGTNVHLLCCRAESSVALPATENCGSSCWPSKPRALSTCSVGHRTGVDCAWFKVTPVVCGQPPKFQRLVSNKFFLARALRKALITCHLSPVTQMKEAAKKNKEGNRARDTSSAQGLDTKHSPNIIPACQ